MMTSDERKSGVVDSRDELFQLQVEQFKHDESYHREIARLTVQHRLNHMALHFAKYVGVIASSTTDGDYLARTIVDGFVIALSTANILNIRLSDHLDKGGAHRDLSSLASHMLDRSKIEKPDRAWLLTALAVPTGRMAKACESVDHLEAYPFRETLVECIVEIAAVLLTMMAAVRIDPAPAVRSRLHDVKKRSVFHGQIL